MNPSANAPSTGVACTHPVNDFMPCGICIPPTPVLTDDQFRAAVAELVDQIDLTDPVIDLTLEPPA